ncbi:MAG: alanine racemase C-terminal domain-containing protein, partial [Elusimicrobiota bacterium]
FSARVLNIREVRKGASIGYASEYVAPRRMKIAALAAGYADGLTMEPAERLIGYGSGHQYWGMRKGAKLPFVGRCGIMHVLVDASGVPDLKVGDSVVLPVRRTAAARAPRVYL